MNPMIHAQNSVKRFGGIETDYLPIHEILDDVKATFNDNRARTITHNIWFCNYIIPRIFGHLLKNSEGKSYAPAEVAQWHVLEDFRMKFIPTIQDYLQNMTLQPWMNNAVKDINNEEATYLAVKTLQNGIHK